MSYHQGSVASPTLAHRARVHRGPTIRATSLPRWTAVSPGVNRLTPVSAIPQGSALSGLGFSLKPPKWVRKLTIKKALKPVLIGTAVIVGAAFVPGALPLLMKGVVGAGKLVVGTGKGVVKGGTAIVKYVAKQGAVAIASTAVPKTKIAGQMDVSGIKAPNPNETGPTAANAANPSNTPTSSLVSVAVSKLLDQMTMSAPNAIQNPTAGSAAPASTTIPQSTTDAYLAPELQAGQSPSAAGFPVGAAVVLAAAVILLPGLMKGRG